MARVTTLSVDRRWLRAIPIGLYLLLSALYLLAVPPGEAPDEPSHLQCIEQVSLLGRLPEVDPRPTGVWWSRTHVISGYLCHHLPLYYLIAGGIQQAVHALTNTPIHFEFPPNYPQGPQPAMFQHARPALALSDSPAVLALRMLSIGLGLVTVWTAYRVTRSILPDNAPGWPAVAAATLVAGWPQFLFMSRAINNDVLATALAALVLLFLLPVGRPRRLIFATITACLAVLAKLNMIFTLGAVGAAYLIEFAAYRDQRRAYAFSAAISVGVSVGAAALTLLQSTVGTHLVRDLQAFNGSAPQALTLTYWLDVLGWSMSSGYARLGWMNVPAPDWQALAWWVFIGVTALIGAVTAVRSAADRPRRVRLMVLGVWALAVLAAYVKLNLNRFQPQFRYAFALLPVLTASAAIGYHRLLPSSSRAQRAGLLGLAVALLAINVWIVFGLIAPTYASG